ncbi:hypothetical protein Rcae01_06005 [Novipirellula caenicola]|uniref:Uncharacterized protein n=1 Tax=Novipirellula caenicola TaxID=1536901 RepID=A0ABP9VZE9_9BACT
MDRPQLAEWHPLCENDLQLTQQNSDPRICVITKSKTKTRFGLSPAETGFFVRAPNGVSQSTAARIEVRRTGVAQCHRCSL